MSPSRARHGHCQPGGGALQNAVDDLPRAAKVAVVGGGFAGAATAWALARAGTDGVVLIERAPRCGQHASGRNAALCRQLADDEDTTAFTVRGAAFLRAPPPGFAERPLLDRTGSILTADDEAGVAALAARAAAHGIAHERIAVADVVGRWPLLAGLRAAGGIYVPGDGVIDLAALLSGFLDGARRGGARVVTSCELLAATPRAGGGAHLETRRGRCDADVVVDAAGAWAGVVGARAGAAETRFTAIQRHLFASAPVATVPGAPYVWHVGDAQLYVRRDGAGLLLSHCDGRAVEPFPGDDGPAADGDAAERLAERVRAVAPELASIAIQRTWACLRTYAPDHRFHIRRDDALPWLFWVAGLGGHGATASAAVGLAAAQAIRGV